MAIPKRIENELLGVSSSNYVTGGATNYLVETPIGVLYRFYIDTSTDPTFDKSYNYGITWTSVTNLKACTCSQLAIWYDRWTDPTGVMGDLIHVVYTDSTSDRTFYRTINTASSDSLGTERTPFTGSSAAAGGAVSVARMKNGNVIIAGSIDAGTETFAYKTADLGVNWTAIANPYEASPDKLIMMPGWGTDTADAMCFYYDNSATEISVKYYDDSGDSWAETSISTSITHPDHTSTTLGHWGATVDHANSQNLLAFWTAVDTGDADLRVFKVTQSAQTETASNVVLNSTDDQGYCGITIRGSDWYVFYYGESGGSEVYSSALALYGKKSTDAGANWGTENKYSNIYNSPYVLWINPITYKTTVIGIYEGFGRNNFNTNLAIPHTTFQLGM